MLSTMSGSGGAAYAGREQDRHPHLAPPALDKTLGGGSVYSNDCTLQQLADDVPAA